MVVELSVERDLKDRGVRLVIFSCECGHRCLMEIPRYKTIVVVNCSICKKRQLILRRVNPDKREEYMGDKARWAFLSKHGERY